MDPVLFGPNGKLISSTHRDTEPCPKCGRGPEDRVPSGGFGQPWFVCKCGYEFNKELLCPRVIP